MPTPNLESAEVAETLRTLIEHWFFEAFQSSVIARSTEAWNHVHAAKEELQRRLVAFLADQV